MINFFETPARMSLVVFALILNLVVVVQSVAQEAMVKNTVWMVGDDPSWAAPVFDDSDWHPISEFSGAPDGKFWVREKISVSTEPDTIEEHVLVVEGAGAFEIFFDGLLVGGSGKIADIPFEEKPGATRFTVGIPPEFLSIGDHVIAFRASALKLGRRDDFFVEYRLEPVRQVSLENSVSMLSLGAAFAAAAILFVFFAVGSFGTAQKKTFYAAISIALGVVLIVAVEAFETVGSISYVLAPWADLIAMIAAVTVFVALPVFLILRFRLPRPRLWIAGIAVVFITSLPSWSGLDFDHDARAFVLLCLFCIGICWAGYQSGHRQAGIFLLGLAVLAGGIVFDPRSLYPFLVLLSMFLSISFADYLRQQQVLAKQAEVTSARLEAEMLRRNIQPHFLMNSLTAVTEWIETAPVEALRFIDGLAEEFRSLTVLSSQKSVRLSDEIDLCRVHLDLMGMRQRKVFNFHVENVDLTAEIPPGVLHTLLENAISHNRYQTKEVFFSLREERDAIGKTLILTAPLGKKTQHDKMSTGSGLQYVRARLEENFPGRWRFSSKPEAGDWVSKIFIENP